MQSLDARCDSSDIRIENFLLPSHFGWWCNGYLTIDSTTKRILTFLIWSWSSTFHSLLLRTHQVSLQNRKHWNGALAVLLAFIPFPFITVTNSWYHFLSFSSDLELDCLFGEWCNWRHQGIGYLQTEDCAYRWRHYIDFKHQDFSGGLLEINVETALYAILTWYLVASKTVDFVVHGIEEYISVMIVSEKMKKSKMPLPKTLEGRGA